MLYLILTVIILVALKIFFRKLKLNGKENVPAEGPMIIVGNHPNTFMDPILVAYAVLPHQAHFLANGSIFKTWIARKILAQLNTIPIYRKQDIHEKRDQLNEDAFQKCFEFLAGGGKLMIFPEGNSINERKLRPLKTGTARIALGLQQQHDFRIPLKILPVGLNYSNPTRFREEVEIVVGKPFEVNGYAEAYKNDPVAAVTALTADIQQRLTELIVVTTHAEEDDLIRKIEKVYKKQLSPYMNVSVDVNITQTIVKAVSYFQEHNPVLVREVKAKIDEYFETAKQYNLTDHLIEKPKPVSQAKLIRYILYFITGFPLYMAGLFFNYIPYSIPSKIARWISSDEEYRAPIMMTAGILTFPLYYGFMFFIGWQLAPSWLMIASLTMLMPLSGFFVLQYYKRLRNAKSSFAYYRIFKRQKDALNWFIEQRQAIITMLESARQQYQ